MNLAGPSNLVVVTHKSTELAIQEAEAVAKNFWANLAEEDDHNKQLAKLGKKTSGPQNS